MKSMFYLLLVFCSTAVFAETNTLTLVDEYKDGSNKVCVYSSSTRTEIYVKDGAGSCPSKKVFH